MGEKMQTAVQVKNSLFIHLLISSNVLQSRWKSRHSKNHKDECKKQIQLHICIAPQDRGFRIPKWKRKCKLLPRQRVVCHHISSNMPQSRKKIQEPSRMSAENKSNCTFPFRRMQKWSSAFWCSPHVAMLVYSLFRVLVDVTNYTIFNEPTTLLVASCLLVQRSIIPTATESCTISPLKMLSG